MKENAVRTLGQLLSDPASTDEQIRAAVKGATAKEIAEAVRLFSRLVTKPHVYKAMVAQAQRNVRILEEKI